MPNWGLKHAWINSLSRFCPVCTFRLKRVLQPPATHTGFECLDSFWCQWLSCSHQGNCWDVVTWWHDENKVWQNGRQFSQIVIIILSWAITESKALLKLPSVVIKVVISVFLYYQWICDFLYVKHSAHRKKPTESYHWTLQFLSALRSFIASVRSLFGFNGCNFTVLAHSHRSHQCRFQPQQAAVFN